MHYEKKSVERLWADKDTANSKRMNNNTDFLILWHLYIYYLYTQNN